MAGSTMAPASQLRALHPFGGSPSAKSRKNVFLKAEGNFSYICAL